MCIISMLECILGKLSLRLASKHREAVEKWTGRICPKIRKKLEKNAELSGNCFPRDAGNGIYHVQSGPNSYIVDIIGRTCDCKSWGLSGILCPHAIAVCRAERIDPEELVHKCYTIETYLKTYGHNIMPLRDRTHWEKLNGMYIHPPLFTKVMGRPATKRRKTPEEKKKKDGTVYLNKKGVAMHCSVCGKDDHNKRGHGKYMERQM